MDESRRAWVLREAGKLHRSFRTELRKDIMDKEGNILGPPDLYSGISVVKNFWTAFVEQSLKEDFVVINHDRIYVFLRGPSASCSINDLISVMSDYLCRRK